jgi:molecular chaperone GrpE (heat shock protein)
MRKLALIAALVALAASLATVALLLASWPARTVGLLLASAGLAALASLLLTLLLLGAQGGAYEGNRARRPSGNNDSQTDDAHEVLQAETFTNPAHRIVDEDQTIKTLTETDPTESGKTVFGETSAAALELTAAETSDAPASPDEDNTRMLEVVRETTLHQEESTHGTGVGTNAGTANLSIPLEDVAGSSRSHNWLSLVEECVELLDELERHKADFDPPRVELAEHVTMRLTELLERSGVEIISDETSFDRLRHQPDGRAAARAKPGAAISETLSPGLAIGRRVLRRAKVRL